MKQYLENNIGAAFTGMKQQVIHLMDSIILSAFISPAAWVLAKLTGYANKILMRDMDLVVLIFTLIGLDAVFGLWKWYKLKSLNEKKFLIGVFEKLIICLGTMVVFNTFIIAAYKHDDYTSYMNLFGSTIILTYPAWSIFRNMFFLTKGAFPPIGFMRKMENFSETADIDEIFTSERNKNKSTETIKSPQDNPGESPG